MVIEDLLVDFAVESHGIFREIPVAFRYDEKYDREYRIEVESVTDGARAWEYEVSRSGPVLSIKIGDPDRTVTGRQRYVITYRLEGALNAFDDHDELYWNVTGDRWAVPIEQASVVVDAPSIIAVACIQGRTGSTEECRTGISPSRADFQSGRQLGPGEQLTIVVGLEKGTVEVPAPILQRRRTLEEKVKDFLGLSPLPIAAAVILGVAALGAIGRLWWVQGRDRWYGDVQYLTGSQAEDEKPLGARETIVVDYAPPEIGPAKRPLRPAEVGVLMDERADTLDVSATIVDLAVRGYLRIIEAERGDYTLEKLREPGADLLEYEKSLLAALFDTADEQGRVRLKDLEDKFYSDLSQVKSQLYELAVKQDRMFPSRPDLVRTLYVILGLVITGLGGAIGFGLGALGAGIVGLPIVLAGLGLAAANGAMPRRSASGREIFRRARGFQEYMLTAEKERARFAEEVNLFEKYLPYAIVYECTDKWAKAFEGLAREPDTSRWYVSPYPFAIATFGRDISGFSSSVSSVMASTPSSSGGSGFAGGGFAGGGGGGGGGGRW